MEVNIPGADEQAVFLRCIGEPTRLQILRFLAGSEKCVGAIVDALNKEQSLVSHHLKALKECNIVVARQEAQKIYYRLTDPRLSELVMTAESLVRDLPLCQCQGVCHAERENQGRRES